MDTFTLGKIIHFSTNFILITLKAGVFCLSKVLHFLKLVCFLVWALSGFELPSAVSLRASAVRGQELSVLSLRRCFYRSSKVKAPRAEGVSQA